MATTTENAVLKVAFHLIAIVAFISNGSAFGQQQSLTEQIMDADETRFAVIFPKLKEQTEQVLPILIREIERKLPSDADDDAKEKLAKRQANAAVALLKLNHSEKVWPLLKHSPDPRARSYLIHRMGQLGADPKILMTRLAVEPDITIRRALLLSLGEFDEKAISLESRKELLPKLQEIYRNDADPGLHAASEWLLRHWGDEAWLRQINEEWAENNEQREKRFDHLKSLATANAPPQWYVNGEGQTMVVMPGPVEFVTGHLATRVVRKHKRRIGRTFALSAKLVTLQEYGSLVDDRSLPEINDQNADLPVVKRSWYGAAKYCNWLSEEEGIPKDQWCFEATDDGIDMKANYLSLTGYRLPTLSEIEYATRAGSMTGRFYGTTDDLLPEYAWYKGNSQGRTQPVGRLKPNDLGLFDVHGNAYTWCQGMLGSIPQNKNNETVEDQGDDLVAIEKDRGMLRGGSFEDEPKDINSDLIFCDQRTSRESGFGLRLARTIKPAPTTPKDGKAENTGK